MPHQRVTFDSESADASTRRATLDLLLIDAPHGMLTRKQIRRRLLTPGHDFESRDAIDRAVRDLISYGVLERVDSHIRATDTATLVASLYP